MSEEKTGGPAFSHKYYDGPIGVPVWSEGLTILDYFAGQALVAAMVADIVLAMNGKLPPVDVEKELADTTYKIAEAMLAERAKRMGKP